MLAHLPGHLTSFTFVREKEEMQTLQANTARLSAGQRLGSRATAGRRMRVVAAGLSPEQQAFLDRKAREGRAASPAPAPTRGRSGSARPASVRPTSRPAAPAAPAYTPAPSAAAPAAGGLSAEQQEFLRRRQAEGRSASPAPAPTRGRSGSARPAPVRPSSRTPSPVRAAAPTSFSAAPSAAAPAAGGLSAEQQEFLRRRQAEGRSASPAPAPTRGRSGSVRPSSRTPSPVRAAAPTSYSSAPSAAAPAAGGLSAEQEEFLRRRQAEGRSASPAPAPTRGRSGSARPAPVRPSSRTPSPVRAAAPTSYSAAPSAAPSAAAPPAGGLSAEQEEFLRRRQAEGRSASPAPAPTRGRSGSARPSSRQPTPAAASYQAPPPPAPEPRVGDVEFARAALERTLQDKSAVHPRDQRPAADAPPPPPPPRPVAPQPTGPSTGRWPDPAFFNETMAAFPAKGVCNPEEARCLIDAGYHVLDVRSEMQHSSGKLRGSVTIPAIVQRQQFDQQRGQMVVTTEDNPTFLNQVMRKFPKKNTHIIVACQDGKSLSIDVLEALEEEGYVNIVGMMGGFNSFYRVFDNRLKAKDRRPAPKRAMKKLL